MKMNELMNRYNELVIFGMGSTDDEYSKGLLDGRAMECANILDILYPNHPSREWVHYKGHEIYGYPV